MNPREAVARLRRWVVRRSCRDSDSRLLLMIAASFGLLGCCTLTGCVYHLLRHESGDAIAGALFTLTALLLAGVFRAAAARPYEHPRFAGEPAEIHAREAHADNDCSRGLIGSDVQPEDWAPAPQLGLGRLTGGANGP